VDAAVAILNAGCAVAMATSPPLSVPLVLTTITKRHKYVIMKDIKAMNITTTCQRHLWCHLQYFPKGILTFKIFKGRKTSSLVFTKEFNAIILAYEIHKYLSIYKSNAIILK
jgi:hypothetical protein